MRLVDGFLEETEEERTERRRRTVSAKQAPTHARTEATEVGVGASTQQAIATDTGGAILPADVGYRTTEGGVRPAVAQGMPGSAAWTESRIYTTNLVQTAQHRLRIWLMILVTVALAFVGLVIAIQVRGARLPPLVRTVDFLIVAGLVAIITLLVCGLAIAVSSFQRRVIWLFDPVTQDRVAFKALEYGDPRGDGATGAYITPPVLMDALRSAAEERLGRNTSLQRLSSRWLLPAECREPSVLIVATERALDRWWDLGLLDAAPVVDQGEVRLVFSGILVQGP